MRLKYGANLALFFLAAAPLAVLLSAIDRYPPAVRDKIVYYQQHRDSIDTLIVGSSYMYYGIDPRVLDATLAGLGIPGTSYNLSLGGSKGHEIDEMIRIILRQPGDRALRRILIDIRPYDPDQHAIFHGTDFFVWWHSPRQTLSVLRSLALADFPLPKRIRLTALHLHTLFVNHLPLGAGRALPGLLRGQPGDPVYLEHLDRTRGYHRLCIDFRHEHPEALIDRISIGMANFRESTRRRPDQLERATRDLALRARDVGPLDAQNVAAWRDLAAEISRHGILPVFVLMPTVDNPLTAEANALAREGIFAHYLNLNDPARHPGLFTMDARYERWHLNEDGAEIFSRILGTELAALIQPPVPGAAEPAGAP